MMKKQHFAFFGKPSKNDDYYVNVEISEEEYTKLCMDYPNEIHNYPGEIANTFRETYIIGHSLILEGWNKLL